MDTMDNIIEREQGNIEIVDDQLTKAHVHKGELMDIEGMTRMVCSCGRVGDENGNLDPVNSEGSLKELIK